MNNINLKILKISCLNTPMGPMIAIADEKLLYLLEFVDSKNLEYKIEQLLIKTKSTIIPGITKPIALIKTELKAYFDGTLTIFKTPIFLLGSPFQKLTWKALINTPYGTTKSYIDLASAISNPTACRAVANANAANKIAILIPCHRIINNNGDLGDYSGGVMRKKWLIQHERNN
ncbi:MAG: methylated-DNA--[protein]-cysteine S-methyltransferase [Gammaproteobacteria bacterium]